MKRLSDSRIRELQGNPDQLVRIYTHQHPDAFARALDRGYLTGDATFSFAENPEFEPAYLWMVDRMREQISGFSGELPVWAWVKRPSSKPLEHDRGPTVRITALVPRRRMVLSDFDDWHSPLAGWQLSLTEAQHVESESTGIWNNPSLAHHRENWRHVFDLRPKTAAEIAWRGAGRIIQACIDRIFVQEITQTRHMRLRPAKRPS